MSAQSNTSASRATGAVAIAASDVSAAVAETGSSSSGHSAATAAVVAAAAAAATGTGGTAGDAGTDSPSPFPGPRARTFHFSGWVADALLANELATRTDPHEFDQRRRGGLRGSGRSGIW